MNEFFPAQPPALPPAQRRVLHHLSPGRQPACGDLEKIKEQYEWELRLAAGKHKGDDLREERYKIQKRHFARFDALLDRPKDGPRWLAEPRFAEIVRSELHALHPGHYHLHAFCLMSNHCHMLMDQQNIPEPPKLTDGKNYTAVSHAMRLLKGGAVMPAPNYWGVKARSGSMRVTTTL